QVDDNISFSRALQRVADQIKDLSVKNRQQRVDYLYKEKNLEELRSLAWAFNEFELKNYRITNENQNLYCDLIKAVWKKTKFRFTAIVFDRKDPNYIREENEHNALYLRALKLYMTYCAKEIKYVYVPDNFDINFDWNVSSGNLPVAILPLQSNASLQIQVADIFTGLIAQRLRLSKGVEQTKKDIVRMPVIETIEKIIGRKVDGNLTIKEPNYFSVWVVKLQKK
ncbi:MAG: hypothetical protein AAB740_04145, partial [Patescibacteria group bacterium]